MRKNFLLVCVLMLINLTVFAENARPVDSRGFEVIAFKNPEAEVSVNTIINNPLADSGRGMPFSLTGDDISYTPHEDEGRVIATWSSFSNSASVTVKITPSSLSSEEGSDVSVSYRLLLDYDYISDGKLISDTAVAVSGEECTFSLNRTLSFSDCEIRFMLSEGIDMSSDEYPEGYYHSDVHIEVQGE